jgi:carbamoyl-phosphate synthase large subunit
MGVDTSVGLAFMKSQLGAGQKLPLAGTVFITVADESKADVLPAARILGSLGFTIVATKGTAAYLSEQGIAVTPVKKVSEGRPDVVDHMKNREIDLVINIVSDKRTVRDSMIIRQTALLYGIPYATTAAGAQAMAQAIREREGTGLSVKSLQEYYGDI